MRKTGIPGWERVHTGRSPGPACTVLDRAAGGKSRNYGLRSSVCIVTLLAILLLTLSGCRVPGNAAPVVKLGLIAPFEGIGRPLGYAVLPAVRIAIADANASGQLGPYRIALVALNDDDQAGTAAEQVRILAEQPEVMGIVGPWSEETVESSIAALSQGGLPGLVTAPAGSLPSGVKSLCPAPDAIAAGMLARLADSGSQVAGIDGPKNALARALEAASSNTLRLRPVGDVAEPIRLHSGDAAAVADDLRAWGAAGWRGQLLGGPDIARSWFAGRAGSYADGVQAFVCLAPQSLVPASFRATYRAQTGTEPSHEAELAYAGARLLVQALAANIRAQGQPTRQGASEALDQLPLETQTGWLMVEKGRWVATH